MITMMMMTMTVIMLRSCSVGNVFCGDSLVLRRPSSVIVIVQVNHRTSTKIADGTRQRSDPRRPQRQPTKLHQLADRGRHGSDSVVTRQRQRRQRIQLTDVVRDVADAVTLNGQDLQKR